LGVFGSKLRPPFLGSTKNKEVACPFKIISTYKMTLSLKQEYHNMSSHHCEKFKFHTMNIVTSGDLSAFKRMLLKAQYFLKMCFVYKCDYKELLVENLFQTLSKFRTFKYFILRMTAVENYKSGGIPGSERKTVCWVSQKK
jgi:hypothetical protein